MTQLLDRARAEAERRHRDLIAGRAAARERLPAAAGVGLGVPVAGARPTLALWEVYLEGLTVEQMDDLSQDLARRLPGHGLTDDYMGGAILNLPDHPLTNTRLNCFNKPRFNKPREPNDYHQTTSDPKTTIGRTLSIYGRCQLDRSTTTQVHPHPLTYQMPEAPT